MYTPPSTNKQIVFLASTNNIIRTLDAETGEVLKRRKIGEPFPMAEAFCSTQISEYVSWFHYPHWWLIIHRNLGIMGTPTIDPETDTAYFYAKSYIS